MSLRAVLTSGGQGFVRDWMAGANPIPPTYIALGSGTLPTGSFLTEVPGETFRAGIAQADVSDRAVTYHALIEAADDLGQIVGCYGIIAGEATNRGETGILIAVGNDPIPFNKNATNAISIDLTLPVSGFLGPSVIVTSGGLALVRNFLAGQLANPPQFIAIGTGASFGHFDNLPTGESYRAPLTEAVVLGQGVEFRALMQPDEAVGTTAASCGVIAGNASSSLGTGVALALYPVSFTKGGEIRVLTAILTVSGSVN